MYFRPKNRKKTTPDSPFFKGFFGFDSITSLKVTLVQGLHISGCTLIQQENGGVGRGGEGEETIQMSVTTRLLCSPITSRKAKIIQGVTQADHFSKPYYTYITYIPVTSTQRLVLGVKCVWVFGLGFYLYNLTAIILGKNSFLSSDMVCTRYGTGIVRLLGGLPCTNAMESYKWYRNNQSSVPDL